MHAGGAREIEKDILSSFAGIAQSLGYSSVHGKIIGVLIIQRKPLSLEELAARTGYSTGMVSLSLDLLEVMGAVRKFKLPGDRRVHIELRGGLLECLKTAIVFKARKSVSNSLEQFQSYRNALDGMEGDEAAAVADAVDLLEKEIRRLEGYIVLLEKA